MTYSATYHHVRDEENDHHSSTDVPADRPRRRDRDTSLASEAVNGNTPSLLCQRQRCWPVALFSTCTILLFADQNLLSPNLTAIAHDFGFDDLERDRKLGGDLALAFFVLGAPVSYVVGYLGDRWHRTRLFALTVGLGEAACLGTYFTTTYAGLYACRAVTGLALGGALPLIYSILGDLFAADERHVASALVASGTGLGISVGQGLAGWLGPLVGSWRLPFLVVSIPALVCAALVWLTVQDPARGNMEQAVREFRHCQQQHQHTLRDDSSSSSSSDPRIELAPLERLHGVPNQGVDGNYSNPSPCDGLQVDDDFAPLNMAAHWHTFCELLATPTVMLTLLQGAPGCLPWGVVNAFLNDYLSENRGMSVQFATAIVLTMGIGAFMGLIIGGTGGTFLYRLDQKYPALLAGTAAIMGCFPFWYLLNGVDAESSLAMTSWMAFLTGVGSGVTGPIVKATLQNVSMPQARGQAFALLNTFDDFGRGLGPVFVAYLIRIMGGRTAAFNVATFGWILCGLFNLLMFFTVEHDEHRIQAAIAVHLSQQHGRDDFAAWDAVMREHDRDGLAVMPIESKVTHRSPASKIEMN